MEDQGPETKLVAVRTFTGNTARLDAELAKGLLASEGIDSEISGEAAADTFPFLDVRLLVRAEDSVRASELLNGLLEIPWERTQSDEAENSDGD